MDETAFTPVGASGTRSTPGIAEVKNSNTQLFKELVRAKYVDSTGNDVRLEMLPPSWVDDQ